MPLPVQFFEENDDPPVRGFLHTPKVATGEAVVLAHGAGSNCEAPLLVSVATALSTMGVTTLRIDLPYRQLRPQGPPVSGSAPRDRAGLRTAINALRRLVTGPFYVGGHSYGGRQASMLLAAEPALASGLLLQSYPLHPPGRPDALRTEHLPRLRVPTLFVHGRTDPFATPAELESARALIPAPTRLLSIDGGHDLGWSKRRTNSDLPDRIAAALLDLVGAG